MVRAVAGTDCKRCWMRVTLSRTVPSSSAILASITICGLNSSGTMKFGAWSKRGSFSARLVLRAAMPARDRTSSIAVSITSPISSETASPRS